MRHKQRLEDAPAGRIGQGGEQSLSPEERERAVLFGPEELDGIGCASLSMPARVTNPWGVEEERDVPIVVCREPGMPLQDLWRREGPHRG